MNTSIQPTFVPLQEGLRAHGLSRSQGYLLINAGLLATWKCGTRRYILLESLRTLPERAAGITREQLLAAGRERRERRQRTA